MTLSSVMAIVLLVSVPAAILILFVRARRQFDYNEPVEPDIKPEPVPMRWPDGAPVVVPVKMAVSDFQKETA